MFFKILFYVLYMVYIRLKGLKYEYIKKVKGEEAANKYLFSLYKKWANFTNKVIGIEMDIKGVENIPDGPCVFMSNHTSIFDIPILISCIDKELGFIAKEELLKIPLIGYWVDKGKNVALNRSNPREGIKSIIQGVEYLKEGYSIVIFPEGTRSRTGELLEFKKGSSKLATKSKKPIIPVYISNAHTLHKDKFKFKSGKVTVIFGEAIETNNLSKEEEKNISSKIFNSVRELSLF